MTTIQKIISEFEELVDRISFGHSFEIDTDEFDNAIKSIKSFLTQTLHQVREETIREVEEGLPPERKPKYTLNMCSHCGADAPDKGGDCYCIKTYNNLRQEIKELINKE